MFVNADCTLIELVGTAANPTVKAVHKIKNVYWNDSRGRTLTKNGVQISDSVMVYLYSDEYIPKAGDMIVHGEVNFEFDNSTQKSAGESMKKFRESYPHFAVVKTVSDYRFGGLPHIEITAR